MNNPAKKSAAEMFANRSRPVVPLRTDEITESLHLPEPLSAEKSRQSDQEIALSQSNDGLRTLQKELEALPKVGNFQLRFEEPIKDQIKEVASKAGLTPETLLQGLWAIACSQPSLLRAAVAEAKEHHQRRSRAAELKNSITRLEKLLKKLI